MPLLEGIGGVEKMSKSLDNYIGINEAPEEIFGKMMSISDELMWRYAELLSDRDLEEIKKIRAQVAGGSFHPMEFKKSLALEIVTRFHGQKAAEAAQDYFETRYQKRQVPKNIRIQFSPPERVGICQLLVDLKFARSKAEAKRLIAQGGVKVDGRTVSDPGFEFQKKLHHWVEVGKNRIAEAGAQEKFSSPFSTS
jgi:tyrosyl-tRNA synthetase